MAIRHIISSDEGVAGGVKLLCYGTYGSGKTHMVLTAAAPYWGVSESIDPNMARYAIPTALLSSVADVEEFLLWGEKSNEAKAYDTLIIDSLSDIAEGELSAKMEMYGNPMQLYPQYADTMQRVLRKVNRYRGSHNIYATAKQAEVYAPKKVPGAQKSGPVSPLDIPPPTYCASMPRKELQAGVGHFFDFVGRMIETNDTDEAGNSVRVVQFRNDGTCQTKQRGTPSPLEMYEAPDLQSIFAKIKGEQV
jgi:AAA domain